MQEDGGAPPIAFAEVQDVHLRQRTKARAFQTTAECGSAIAFDPSTIPSFHNLYGDDTIAMPTTRHDRRHFSRAKTWSLLLLLVIVVVAIILVSVLQARGFFQESREKDDVEFVPSPIVENSPGEVCSIVDATVLNVLTAEKRWQHALKSMRHYMKNSQLEGISAFHVGEPYCFMIVKTLENTTIEMYNPQFKGYSPTSIINRDEVSLSCSSITRVLKRSNYVLMSYLDATTGAQMLVRLKEREAWAAQHIGLHSNGYSICELHRADTDKGVETLRQILHVT
jgi:peptide deformylase